MSAIVVTSTGDSIALDGVVTLREAITSLNNGADVNGDIAAAGLYGTNDTISFDIPGAGVQTISPATPLPTIMKPVILDGYTQSGTSVNTLDAADNAVLFIEISGSGAGSETNGLILGAGSDGSTISGLVINDFGAAGILVQSDGNTIAGNFLGTNSAGLAGVSLTGTFGVLIEGSSSNTIGGTAVSARNIIGGNSDGIHLNTGSQSTLIQGNFIGVGADGTTAVGNRLHGVGMQGDGGLGIQNNQIGGTDAGTGNIIANNGAAGVAIFGSPLSQRQNSGNTILGNSIFNNGLNSPGTIPGIDLSAGVFYPNDNGVTVNDLGDLDIGPNLLQNYPVLTSATSDLVSTTIIGTLNSANDTTYRIEFFSNPTLGAGFGQGQTYLGFVNVTTDATGLAIINATLPVSVPNGQFVTSTATSGGIAAGTSQTGIHPNILGSAVNFAILAGSTVTTTGLTSLVGDVGISPGSALDGTPILTGTVHLADPIALQAQTDLTTAYDTLVAQPGAIDLSGSDLGTMVLVPGVYRFTSSAQLTGILTLDTQGDPHATFVFQIVSTLTTAVNSSVVILGSTDSIFWQVGSSATIGVGSQFAGNIVAFTSITLGTGASLTSGRALARNGAVTLDSTFVDSTTPPANNTSEFSAAVQIPIPEISIDDVTIAEGNAGTTNAVFTVTLSEPSQQFVTVLATTSNGTATAGTDYVGVSVTVTFAPGETSKTVTVPITIDAQNEPDETFFVDLSLPTNALLEVPQGLGTITNDDPQPTLSIDDVVIVEGNTGTSTAVFTVTLSAASGQTVTVVAASAVGTAGSPIDYVALLPTTLTFAPGETTKIVNVTINGDVVDELNETFFIDLTLPTNATITDSQGLGTITNDESVSTLTISSPIVTEGDAGTTALTFIVTSSNAIAGGFSVAFDVSNVSTNSLDYVLPPVSSIVFLGTAGETQTITILVNGDTTPEANETLTVTLGTVVPASLEVSADNIITGAIGTGTIINDDNVLVSIAAITNGAESNTPTDGLLRVTQTIVSLNDTVVNYTITGTATAGSDYTTLTGSVTIPAGQTSADINIAVLNDLLAEGTETVTVTLSSLGDHGPLVVLDTVPANLTATVNILDDDVLAITTVTSLNPPENTPTSTVLVDVDTNSAAGTTLVYSLTGIDASAFNINPATGEITFAVSPNFEIPTDSGANNVYNVTVNVTADFVLDQSASQDLVITVAPLNDNTPVISPLTTTATVASGTSNSTVIFDINATDADLPAQTLTYSLSGPDNLLFAINSTTGEITFVASPDVAIPLDQGGDNVYNLTVTVTDSVEPSLSASQALTVTVMAQNQIAPVITSGATATVAENTPISTVIIDVNATDASVPAQTLTYSLSGPDSLAFGINSTTGEITFLVSPNYEAPTDQGLDNVYHVTVTVSDNGAPILSDTQDLTITVTAVDEAPPIFVDSSPTFSIPENSPVGTVVGGVTATDSDSPPTTLTYSIVGGNGAGAFTINPNTGVITVANSSPLDFEVIQQFTLQVRVTNNATPTPMSADATVVVNITDVQEGPTITIPVRNGLFHLGRIPAFVSPVATFTNDSAETPNYAGAQMTVAIVANRGRRDKLNIFPKGNGNDQISVKGRKVYFGGLQIGTFTGGKGARNPNLVITFNSNATTRAIDGLVRRLNFFAKDNVGTIRTVNVQITNIGGVDSNVATRDIQVTDQQDATL